jgi:hypothetical protein
MGTLDGTLSRSDLLTRLYQLAATYSEGAERRRAAQDQGVADLKGLFNDLQTRLEGRFELTKEQMVCHARMQRIRYVANLASPVQYP